MSTTQRLFKETWHPKPQNNLVGSKPVKTRGKLSLNNGEMYSFQNCTWEDLRGLSFVLDEEV